jgi:hypothetical protein
VELIFCVKWATFLELGLWRMSIDELCLLSAFELFTADGSWEKLDELVISSSRYIQGDRKVTQPFPDTCSICQKINYIDASRWRVPVSRKWFTRRDIVDLFGTGESRNVSLNSYKLSKDEMPGSVRQWTLFALVKNTSLYLDFWKTTDRLARRRLCSHSDIVFINPVELYWIATINKYFNMDCLTFRSFCVYRKKYISEATCENRSTLIRP